jgi:hypothetical protein
LNALLAGLSNDKTGEARRHALQKHCVAIDLRIEGPKNDLEEFEFMGMFDVGEEQENKDNDANDE